MNGFYPKVETVHIPWVYGSGYKIAFYKFIKYKIIK